MINYSKVNSILNDEKYWEAVYDSFGTWLGFWYGDENFTFEETKEVFFLTLKKLLDDDLVVFFPPEKNSKIKLYKHHSEGQEYEEELWDETSDNIVAYIKNIFPKDVQDENDEILTNFWYGICPEIGWIDKNTGELVAS